MERVFVFTYDEWFDWVERNLQRFRYELELDENGARKELEKLASDLIKTEKVDGIFVGEITPNKKIFGYVFDNAKDFAKWCWEEYGRYYWLELMESKKAKIVEQTEHKIRRVSHGSLAGKVLIIDPSYVFPGELWDKLVEMLPIHVNDFYEIDGHKIYIASTWMGDGVYPVYVGGRLKKKVDVDSGLLSAIPKTTFDYLLSIGGSDESRLGVWVDLGSEAEDIWYDYGNWGIGGYVEVITRTRGA